MKRATLSRRLLAGAAGLVIGVGGILGLASPAQATVEGPAKGPEGQYGKFLDKGCDGIKVFIDVGRTVREWRIVNSDGPLWTSDGTVQGGVIWKLIAPEDAHGLDIEWQSLPNHPWKPLSPDHILKDEGRDWTPPPGAWPKCGDSPQVEIIEDCDGKVTVTVHAGNTLRTWRVGEEEQWLGVGESHAWMADSIDVKVEWKHNGEWKEADEKYVTRTPAEDCPTTPPDDDGGDGGGELPETGTQVLLVAGGALVLLTLGGAMFFMARRRRISFTA